MSVAVSDISSTVTVAGVGYDLINMTRDGDKANIRREKDIGVKYKKSGVTGKIELDKVQPVVVKDEEEEEVPRKKSKSSKKSSAKNKIEVSFRVPNMFVDVFICMKYFV